jgi:hypothetical protein
MNDVELAAAVKESVRGAQLNIPAEQIVHRSRAIRARRRKRALAGGLTAAATAAAVVALTSGLGALPKQDLTGGHARIVVTAAWTVRQDADGTVTIYLRQYANRAGLQETLRADGVNAIVRPVPTSIQTVALPGRLPGSGKPPLRVPRAACSYAATNNAPPAIQRAVVTFAGQGLPALFTIHPASMPPGSALLLPFLTGMPPGPKTSDAGVLPLMPVVLNNDTVPACVPSTKIAPPPVPAPKTK